MKILERNIFSRVECNIHINCLGGCTHKTDDYSFIQHIYSMVSEEYLHLASTSVLYAMHNKFSQLYYYYECGAQLIDIETLSHL